jgi:3-hydroxyisobutyrate dehydrogenase-like beta-hydroxyacid dehydrogenase
MSIQPPAKVGFLGLGIMGEGQASNLLKAGFELVVWTRDTAKAAALASAHPPGAVTVAASAREVLGAVRLTYSMLSTLAASEAVFDGPDGVLSGVSACSTIVDCATLTPERMGAMAAAVRAKGGAFLEAPVSGSKKPAADGQLVFLCAGDKSAFELATAGLDAMGKSTHYYGTEVGGGAATAHAQALTSTTFASEQRRAARSGQRSRWAVLAWAMLPAKCVKSFAPCGHPHTPHARARRPQVGVGTRMKLVVNMVMGAQLAAIGEGIALCEAAGLSATELVDVLKEGAMASPLVTVKGAAIVGRAYAPAFPLTHAQKDMGFALDLGKQLGVELPVAFAANALFEEAKAAGHADADFSAVAEASRAKARGAGNGSC